MCSELMKWKCLDDQRCCTSHHPDRFAIDSVFRLPAALRLAVFARFSEKRQAMIGYFKDGHLVVEDGKEAIMGKPANFQIVLQTPTHVVIFDRGPWDVHFTITNDAENVVRQLAPRLCGR